MKIQISRNAQDYYRFDEWLFSITGEIIFSNFHGARVFAQKINEKRNVTLFPERTVKAGDINAMGLISEILHYVVTLYQEQKNPDIFARYLKYIYQKYPQEQVDSALKKFVDEFPPLTVYKKITDVETYLNGRIGDRPTREIAIEKMMLLYIANKNPAFSPYIELFDDTVLKKETIYTELIDEFHSFLDREPYFGPDNQNLMEMLRSPAIAVPHSLYGQLQYIYEKWGYLLDKYIKMVLLSLDFIKEESKPIFFGLGEAVVYEYSGIENEPERFSSDIEWMSRLVLLAKHTYVWLDQLSKKYHRNIRRLDEIPDEELDTLARWGFTGLWLIGIWERSPASQKIKRLCGNPDAISSAYSLYDYEIARDLGGEEAFCNLKERTWKRGIRLCCDIVPNHMGIYSKWIVEHPDWFISLDYPPFPTYTFNGVDLSDEQRIGIYLEDHYYNRTDAAVVFKHVERNTEKVRYIYHGNDGTRMPWNDTAQLNYLNPEVREAVIQKIIDVAQKFSIIRFDAAMTLTKKHYQRLWFPSPGSGGDIPSRSEFGLSKAEFDKLMPQEFWREVVDRVAKEVPDTLLLAEAFWLLEGFFVRTLGMHRVYNSAFMNMLKTEDNAKYRMVMKNTLEFDPEILKRFVNFMNNPDEEPAIVQFGKDDKYFGVCTMLATLPGLPMFGHGQIEGFSEKYGMEYPRAYWNEEPDRNLIERHEREIFPLLRRRALFANVNNFLLYDCFTPEGYVNEDVFAYSNRYGNERALIVYHNKYGTARGFIRTSVGFLTKIGSNGERKIIQKTLGEGLAIPNDSNYWCIFRDHVTGLEYIRNCKELWEKGLYIELGAFKYHVFLDFREVMDNEQRIYSRVAEKLNGRGVYNILEFMHDLILEPVHNIYRNLMNTIFSKRPLEIIDVIYTKTFDFLSSIKSAGYIGEYKSKIASVIKCKLHAICKIYEIRDTKYEIKIANFYRVVKYLNEKFADNIYTRATLFGWLFTDFLKNIEVKLEELKLEKVLSEILRENKLDEYTISRCLLLIKILGKRAQGSGIRYEALRTLFTDREVQQFLNVNCYQETLWFNKESYEELLSWLFFVTVVEMYSSFEISEDKIQSELIRYSLIIEELLKMGESSGYQIEKLLKNLSVES